MVVNLPSKVWRDYSSKTKLQDNKQNNKVGDWVLKSKNDPDDIYV